MGKIWLNYKRNPHQAEFHDDILTKYLDLSSGFGGGKSYALAMKAFQLSALNRGIPGGCVVPSIADYKKDLLPIIEGILDENRVRYRYHKTDKWFLFPWSRGKMYVTSAEKRIRGPNWGWAVINEVSLIAHERYKEAIGRVRIKGCPYPQVASCGTPEGTSHWRYEVFVENPMPNSRIIYGDTRDNQDNLADDYIPSLEASYDPIMLDAYLRGLHVNMNGSRFYYAYDPKVNDDKTIERIEGAEVYVSLDYNVSPMVATLWNIVHLKGPGGALTWPDGSPMRRARAFDQIVIPDGADIYKMCRALENYPLDPDLTTIYPDPAGKARAVAAKDARSCNETLKAEGWTKVKVKATAPQFRRRQLGHNNLLAKGLIKLNPDKCKALKRDYEGCEQDPATFEKLKTNPKLTHASEGADYFQDIEFPFSGHKPNSGSIKYR